MKEMVCKYCKDEFCVNDQCPMRADYRPVPDIPGVCKHEERVEVKPEITRLTPKECLLNALAEFDVIRVDSVLNDIYETFRVLLTKNDWEITEYCEEDDEAPWNNDDVNEVSFAPGQTVNIWEISKSADWIFDRKIKDHDIHESIIYVSSDKTLIVSFDDESEVGTVMLNREKNERENCDAFTVGQRVSRKTIASSDKWMFVGYREDDTTDYVSKDETLHVSFDDGREYGTIVLNQNNNNKNQEKIEKCGTLNMDKKKFFAGQTVTLHEIENSGEWKLKSTATSPFDTSCSYVSKDDQYVVRFEHKAEHGTVKPNYYVGKSVHVGRIGESNYWRYTGEDNDRARYETVDKTLYVNFGRNSDWGLIMMYPGPDANKTDIDSFSVGQTVRLADVLYAGWKVQGAWSDGAHSGVTLISKDGGLWVHFDEKSDYSVIRTW